MINLLPFQKITVQKPVMQHGCKHSVPLISTISDTAITNSKQQVQTVKISNWIPLTLDFFFLQVGFNTRNFLPILCIGEFWLACIKVLSRSLTSSFASLGSFQHLNLSAREDFPNIVCCIPSRAPQPPAPQLCYWTNASKTLRVQSPTSP